ncbi:MAG TPA: hypothetical protein VJ720_11660 [Chitinophaga sp.]|nr:hypothetical protein [Chitinophaga sp.]
MNNPKHRREFLRQMALYTMGAGLLPSVLGACNTGSSTKESKDSPQGKRRQLPVPKNCSLRSHWQNGPSTRHCSPVS